MTHAVHLSPIQYVHTDGRITVEGLPNVKYTNHSGTRRRAGAQLATGAWSTDYHEEWEAMARPRSLTSGRRIRFVLMDESVTRLQGTPRLQPQHVMLPYPMRCPLTLSHTGFVVGTVFSFLLIREQDREALKGLGIDQPDFTEGQWILSEAELFSSVAGRHGVARPSGTDLHAYVPGVVQQARRADRRGPVD